MNIVLFGPPGCGKGTQSLKIANHLNMVHISTGDLLRKEVASNSGLGLKIKALIDKGNFAPDSMITEMLKSYIDLSFNNFKIDFIFDGYPRNIHQAKSLDEILADRTLFINKAIFINVDKEELVARLLLRGQSSGRADDESEDIILRRYKKYKKETMPIKEYYSKQNKLIEIDGNGSVEDIYSLILSKV